MKRAEVPLHEAAWFLALLRMPVATHPGHFTFCSWLPPQTSFRWWSTSGVGALPLPGAAGLSLR